MNATHAPVETQVLIVGAGPSGAATSALLSTYGIDNIVINRSGGPAPTPRAHITNQRTMEVLRDLGLEREAKRAATPQHLMGEHVWGTTLAGEELGRMLTWYNHPKWKAEHDLASPCSVCDMPQTEMEPLLLNAATNRGAKLLLNTEYLGHEQRADGVTVRLRDRLQGRDFEVVCKYLVGADGGRSQVAKDIGLELQGQGGLGGSIGVYFEADLSRYVAHRPGDMYWLVQPGVGMGGGGFGVLRMVRTCDRWVATSGYDVNEGVPELTDELGRDIVYRLIGEKAVDVKVLDISPWIVNKLHAEECVRGRVVCIGDAIHRHPPMNGLGSNTCIQDAYNLSWKLAMILKGQAGERLLRSVETERIPVGRHVVKTAFENMGVLKPIFGALGFTGPATPEQLQAALEARKQPTPEAAKMRADFRDAVQNALRGFNTLGAELNQRYASDAIVGDGTPDPGFDRDPDFHYEPSTRPGCHLPHVWLLASGRKVSTFDLCGGGRFTLLTGIGGEAWCEAAEQAARVLGIDVTVHVIGPGQRYDDIYGDFARMRATQESGALLVRPDLFVGWRADSVAQADRLTEVLGAIVHRQPEEAAAATRTA